MENNTPEGPGCSGCPGENSVCADNIRNIIGQWKNQRWYVVKKNTGYEVRIEMYGFDRDVVDEYRLGMEQSEKYELLNEEELYSRLTEAC